MQSIKYDTYGGGFLPARFEHIGIVAKYVSENMECEYRIKIYQQYIVNSSSIVIA